MACIHRLFVLDNFSTPLCGLHPSPAGDFFPAAYNCPHEVERIGTVGDGGRWTCGLSRLADKEDCIIYTFGKSSIFFSSSFIQLVNRIFFFLPLGNNHESTFEAEVLDSTRHCQIWGYDFRTKSLGPGIPRAQQGRVHFHRFGLAGADKHGPTDRPAMYTLESLMNLNGELFLFICYSS